MHFNALEAALHTAKHKIRIAPPAAACCFRKYGVHAHITSSKVPYTAGFFSTADLDSVRLLGQ